MNRKKKIQEKKDYFLVSYIVLKKHNNLLLYHFRHIILYITRPGSTEIKHIRPINFLG